ncbi:MAG: thioredoxin family protein [Desulfobaccales bacterium]
MKTVRILVCLLGLTLGALLLTSPWATESQAAGTVVYEFRSRICPYCYELSEILDELKKKYPGQMVVQDFWSETDEPMFKRYQVSLVPTLIIVNASGREIFRHEGMIPKEQLVSRLKGLNVIRD